MPKNPSVPSRRAVLATGAGLSLASAMPAFAATPTPSATPLPGKPVLLYGAYDLSTLGYQQDEYVVSGAASAYSLPGPATPDGMWSARPSASAPYATRIVVMRPKDPSRFNGTVLVEWFNVTAGQDTPADWMVAHREMARKGYAYVGVSAQKVGVEGGPGIMPGGVALKKADPARYGRLSHPGDAYAYDIFSQAGALLKSPGAGGVLGPLKPRSVVALGESQSAAFLTTYVNAVDPVARVYDGFFVHSRFGSCAGLDGTRIIGGPTGMPADVRYRSDLRVPVPTLITETDILGNRMPGYHAARQPDTDRLRVWELAGAAHADNYLFKGAFIDSGRLPVAALAACFQPTRSSPMGELAGPLNPGMPHHYVVQAAVHSLNRWVRDGAAPLHSPRLTLASGGHVGVRPSLARDANGLALGGIRTPWVDIPTMVLSGAGDPSSPLASLVGLGDPFDPAKLAALYPGGKPEYLRLFGTSLEASIGSGYLLADDRDEILAIAGVNFPTAA